MLMIHFLFTGDTQMGKERQDSNQITRDYFDSLMIEMRHIDSEIPDTRIKLFGQQFSMPIATAALSHLNNTAPEGMTKMAEGARMADALCFSAAQDGQVCLCDADQAAELLGRHAPDLQHIFQAYSDRHGTPPVII